MRTLEGTKEYTAAIREGKNQFFVFAHQGDFIAAVEAGKPFIVTTGEGFMPDKFESWIINPKRIALIRLR